MIYGLERIIQKPASMREIMYHIFTVTSENELRGMVRTTEPRDDSQICMIKKARNF